jgi:hypothetical protein
MHEKEQGCHGAEKEFKEGFGVSHACFSFSQEMHLGIPLADHGILTHNDIFLPLFTSIAWRMS